MNAKCLFAIGAIVVGCSSSNAEEAPKECSPQEQTGCPAEQSCELVQGGKPACFASVAIEGKVVDAADSNKPVANARVVARDPDGAAQSNVAISGADGSYKLVVPSPRDAAGKSLAASYTLRADADGYVSFPGGIRVALPIDVATAQAGVVKNAATTLALNSTGKTGLGSIGGAVKAAFPGGTLVVAKGPTTATAIADRDGAYRIFNLEAGSYEVRAYAAGLNFSPGTTSVAAAAEAKLDLASNTNPLGKVSGSVSIVNAPGGSITSVVLAVKSTFNEALYRGEVPRGLRAKSVTGAFSIEQVPDGEYVILAAFDNDNLVRDPSSIGGTAILSIHVAGAAVDAGGFKVTEALAVRSPGASGPENVTGTPTFVWADDSSETGYVVQVFDALGAKIWEDANVAEGKGAKDISVPYAGPSLVKGGYYQFRATSMKSGTPISRTEDLKGIFVVQ